MKHNLLKSVIISVILLMGVSNAWAGHGFFNDDACGIKLNYSGTTTTEIKKNSSGASTHALGTITKLYLKGWWFAAWENTNDFNGKESGKLYYRVYLAGSPSGNYTSTTHTYYNWGGWNNGSQNVWLGTDNLNTNILNGLVGGNYIFEYYFTMGSEYLSNGSNNYTISFTYNPTYTVTVNAGTGGSVAKNSIVAGNITEQTLPTATPNTGYSFANWTITNGNLTLSSATSPSNATVKARSTGTVTANFTPATYTITYKDQGGSNFSGTHESGYPTTHTYGTATTLSTASKTGYTFEGWYKEAACTNKVTSLGATAYTSNITLYAKWTAKTYTVTLNPQSGTGGTTSVTATYGSAMPAITKPTRTGYTFNGYYDATSGGTQYYKADGSSARTWDKAAATTLYAQWTANQYNITYKDQGNVTFTGTHADGAPTKHTYGTATTLKTASKTGYNFDGWFTTQDCSGSAVTTLGATAYTSAITLYAKWTSLPENTVYLKPVEWANDGARFAVYAFHNNASNGEWYDMTLVGCTDYYKCDIPAKYTQFSFCRMNPKKGNDWSNKWNQTNDFAIATYKNQIFTHTTWGQGGEKCTGNWAAYKPTITLTLKSSTNGIYRVRNNGNTYVSSLTEDVVVELPINTEINIAEEGAHLPNHGYKLKQCFIQIGNNEKEEATIETKKYGLCGSTTISANFVTKEANTVYFKPNANWTSDNAKFAVYLYDEAGEDTWINLTQDAGGYYTCVIPEEWSNLIFVRLNPSGGLNWDSKWNQTYSHHIPVTRYNAYTLHADKWGQGENEGWWSQPEATNGDYRLLYVEQLVEKEDWKTVINRTKQHPSDIIKKRSAAGSDIVSLHIYTQGDNPEVILQQYNGSKWVDIEAHMVNGPLEALPGTAMLPGRKNASPDSDIDDFVYDDGIEVIKTDDEDAGCGVWNFTIVQDGSTATLDLTADGLKRYEGKYYIRTDASAGGWSSYTIPANYMTFSSYSKTHSDFSHYYCQWILQGTNVKFTIANDYGYAISDTLDGDSFVPKDGEYVGTLSEKANIRFSWNQVNNNIYRAYIKGAYDPDTHERLKNIVATYKTESSAKDKEVILDDSGNWIYQTDITDVKVGSSLESLIAEYRDVEQIFEENIPMLTGEDSETYTVRILYDFKIDKTLVTLVPNNKEANISIDVLIERVNQGEANQVKAGINAARTQEGSTVYAVMSFTQDHIESSKTEWERLYYWVSFPFDVRISEVFGFGEYGEHWIMQYYDGEERAAKGCWIDSPTYWRFITDTTGNDWTNGVLKANKGYVLALTTDIADLNIFQHTDKVSLYFPSTTLISNINADVINTTVELEPYTCTIERNNRYIYDSNWHIIGIPSYANKDQALKQSDLFYFYTYNTANNTYSVTTADPRDSEETVGGNNVTFKSMHSYMVQYAGTINWQETWVLGAKGLAAKTSDSEDQTHSLRLELQQSNTLADKTFIKLQDKAGITDEFDLNIDLTKIINSGANIYTLAGTESIQLAGNVLPIEETIIPIGIQLDAAGEYTFAMPEGTDGIVVELIDYQANTTTNLLFNDYTVSLPKGTFDNRFALSVKPDKTATSVANISNEVIGDKAKKYIIDGVLYMQKDGVLYDAQGHIVR